MDAGLQTLGVMRDVGSPTLRKCVANGSRVSPSQTYDALPLCLPSQHEPKPGQRVAQPGQAEAQAGAALMWSDGAVVVEHSNTKSTCNSCL